MNITETSALSSQMITGKSSTGHTAHKELPTQQHSAKFAYNFNGRSSTNWYLFIFFKKTSHRSQARWLNVATTNTANTPSRLFIE